MIFPDRVPRPCPLRMAAVPGTHPFCSRHNRLFSGQPWHLSDLECRYAQTRASKAPQASRPGRTPQGRVGTKRRPCRSHPLFFCGHGVPANPLSCVSFSRQRKKRRSIRISRRPYQAWLADLPLRGKPGETPCGTPKGRPPTPGGRARKRDAGAWRYPCARRGTTFPKLP